MNKENYKPIPFYFITTDKKEELTFECAVKSLANVKKAGFGGVILFNKPPQGFNQENYLGETWFYMIKNFTLAAKELNLKIWINDGFDYPPGAVAGRVEKLDGGLSQQRVVLKNGEIGFEKAEWGYPAFEHPRSAELFQKLVYEAYKKHVGEFFGNVVEGFFSDADNRKVNYEVFSENSKVRDYFPWSDGFDNIFTEKYGYDIKPYLKSILKRENSTQAVDYWEFAGELYQSWFKSNYKWCRENGLKYTFHTSDTTPMKIETSQRSSVFTEGRIYNMQANCDFPGTDQELLELNGGKHYALQDLYVPEMTWGGSDKGFKSEGFYNVYGDLRAKLAASTAFLANKEGAMCEMFAASNWGATYNDLRCIAAFQIMQGISFVVPHAYHYRLLGNTKYFAPPDFSANSHLNFEISKFNDMLTEYACICGEGELIAPIAVTNITEELWRGTGEPKELFDACEALNRLPYGYVIADVDVIKENKDRFLAVIDTGAERIGELENTGLEILKVHELDKLTKIIPCDISYSGEGNPHFLRKRMPGGEETLIIANIENEGEICGTLKAGNKVYHIALETGEIAYFRGNMERYRKPGIINRKVLNLPKDMEVCWLSENMIPLERFENANGNAVLKTSGENELFFTFSAEDDVSAAKLYLPKTAFGKVHEITVNNKAAQDFESTKMYDEDYVAAGIKLVRGRNVIKIEKNDLFFEEDRLLLTGDFGVDIKISGEGFMLCGAQYNLNRYIPKDALITLKSRQKILSLNQSWAEQGHPFYSGEVIYKTNIHIAEEMDNALLHFPGLSNGCKVYIDGEFKGSAIFKPYSISLSNISGEHSLEVKVSNTYANAFECYKAKSGIYKGGFITGN